MPNTPPPDVYPPDVYEDDISLDLARVMASANARYRTLGLNVAQSLISITQRPGEGGAAGSVWRMSDGPRDYVGQRCGDLIIDIEPADASVVQVLRGQL